MCRQGAEAMPTRIQQAYNPANIYMQIMALNVTQNSTKLISSLIHLTIYTILGHNCVTAAPFDGKMTP